MFVVPEVRGKSYHDQYIGEFLLRALSKEAWDRGWLVLKLETGRSMTRARRFYERHGYVIIPNYGEYVDCSVTISYEKVVV